MAQTILYYPQIDIQDGAWLRNAILYWDEVSSIVPYENYEGLSPELLYLQNLGIYNAVNPQNLFHSEFAGDFYDSIVKRISAFDYSMRRHPARIQNERVSVHMNKIYAPALHELIHYRKLPQNLLTFFDESGFVNDYNADGWIEMDSRIVQIYMRTLAEYSIKCSDKDIVLGTNTAGHNREIYGSAYSRTNTQCCKINIVNCLPQPTMDVGFEEILDFKERRREELGEFRAKIRELETNIYHADSPELIKHHEAQFVESWQQCSNDFYRVLKEARIAFFLTSLSSLVAIPLVEQLLSRNMNQNFFSAIQTGAQLVNIGIGYYNYKEKVSPRKTDGGFSYIIKANREGIIHI